MSAVVAQPVAPALLARLRPALVYVLVAIVGAAAFLYPFWFPAESVPNLAHSGDAPLWAGHHRRARAHRAWPSSCGAGR